MSTKGNRALKGLRNTQSQAAAIRGMKGSLEKQMRMNKARIKALEKKLEEAKKEEK